MTNPAPRALVVEDDNSWQQILSEILSDSGLEVDIADNVDDATLVLKAHPHRLAVVDLSLSPKDHNNYDGLRVLDAVRRVDPNCQTILLTGFATVELAVTALTDYGAFTFLRKEVSIAVNFATLSIESWLVLLIRMHQCLFLLQNHLYPPQKAKR